MSGEQVFGLLFVALGVVSLIAHIALWAGADIPWVFSKLKPTQERSGEKAGTAIHFFGYVVAPIAFGVLLLMGYVL